MSKIIKEIEEVTGIARAEESQEHYEELVRSATQVDESEWEGLSDPAQTWVNIGSYCLEQGEEIPSPDDKEECTRLKIEMDEADGAKAAKQAKVAKAKSAKAAKAETGPEKTTKTGGKPVKAAKANGSAKAEGSRGRKGTYPLNAKIKVLVKSNPHREGTSLHDYYEKYRNNMTVQEALDAGIVWANLRYLSEKEVIQIG